MMWHHHGHGSFRHDLMQPFTRPFMHNGYGGWWFLALAVVSLAALVLLIILAVSLLRGATTVGSPSTPPQLQALEVLRRRYASGEIDDKEFQHRVEVLGEHHS